jgi:alpha 1,2-mannosyltransferase
MQDEKKVYGFTLSLFEYIETIPTLWATVKGGSHRRGLSRYRAHTSGSDFIKEHPEHIAEDNAMKFLSDDGGDTYNKCHCE